MFHRKIYKLFKGLPSVFGIADDILIAGFNGKVLRICRQANLKLNKDMHLFRGTSIPFFSKVIS